MRVAVLTKTGFEIQEVEIPSIGDDEVLIKTLSCGVCSGDVFVYRNRNTLAEEYRHLGHEGTGRIIDAGKDVVDFQEGDIVTTPVISVVCRYISPRNPTNL